MSRRPAVVFCMPGRGHFRRLVPVIAGLVEAGVPTHVFTDSGFAADVIGAGAHFVDLFAGRPLAAADAQSIPIPSRYVSFAGHYGDAVARAAAALRPGLVLHDTFAVIGQVVANHLGVPRVNVCAGHNAAPAPTLAALRVDPRVAIAPACHAAVRALRERHGIADASPFSYVTALSPDLNLCCEPAPFLRRADRAPFEPLAFFGSLSADAVAAAPAGPPRGDDRGARVYVSFGTVIWSYYADAARAALAAVADAVAAQSEARALVSLGGEDWAGVAAGLRRPNVRVEGYVDQARALRQATVFITHHGLNSTHEAVLCQVPMLSYPFFGDQPDMALRCQELGLALPLVATPRAAITPDAVRGALAAVAAQRPALAARLAEARAWELAAIRDRPAVIARRVSLMAR
ncbi:MAG: glycosyltransferase [Candidatus Binatia bacterium]